MQETKQDHFKVQSKFEPAGDQPKVIEEIVQRVKDAVPRQTLLGITGSGKTFTMAKIIELTQKPALVLAHNKTLAGQLCNEFKEFFPENRVEYFISYYDYYQPESYIPHSDTFIEKTAKVNDDIDRMRYSTTRSIFERDDVIVVASVSCIYGLGIPELYFKSAILLEVGMLIDLKEFLNQLVGIQYRRNDTQITRGLFRVRGEIIEIHQADEERILRIEFFGDEIERLAYVDRLTGEILELMEEVKVFPAKHYVTDEDTLERAVKQIEKELEDKVNEFKKQGKDVEAQRILQRTRYDIEMIKEVGYCNGIENYSRILEEREPGSSPKVLIDYMNRRYGEDGWICFIDESHMTLPQLRAMYYGDLSRKSVLVDYGFRLPCAIDNRPLKYEEFDSRAKQIIYVSATPGEEELERSPEPTELIIRPTGLVDPELEIHETKGQVDKLIEEIKIRTARSLDPEQYHAADATMYFPKNEKVIVNTLTKKMAEDLSEYLVEHEIAARYLHSEIKSLDRIKLLNDLRKDEYDVLVGVNLLREGIDLPEVSLVCIMDADKEGFLRNYRTLIQMIGRAARNSKSKVIMFADRTTDSMAKAIDETDRRRAMQVAHNIEHCIIPRTVLKPVSNPILDAFDKLDEEQRIAASALFDSMLTKPLAQMSKRDLIQAIDKLEDEMKDAAKSLDFENAALYRDHLKSLREKLEEK
ncbi:MAG: excinuclease ABC subunit UvrB [Cyanobacteria bacterium]|nr:excinuclease ABC subunit UvrB [Cyanobacteriota bacterium]MDA1020535.1 excinuclease ABC subunit UvrB [Cyanobacteriota bacterium]